MQVHPEGDQGRITCFVRDEMVRYGRPGMAGYGTVRYGLVRHGGRGSFGLPPLFLGIISQSNIC